MPASKPVGGRFILLALGALVVATLGCLAVVGPPVVGWSESGPRVVAAVRDGYPELCSEWRDKLVAAPSPASWYTQWDVSCISGYMQSDDKIMTVNVVTCQWREPFKLSLDWHALLASATAVSYPLRRCP